MKIRVYSALIAILATVTPSYAFLDCSGCTPPTTVPEIDYKLAVGGLVIAIAGIALLIESYRRRKAASN